MTVLTMQKTGRLRLKGAQLLKMGRGAENPHELTRRSGVSYTTVAKYVTKPDEMNQIDLHALPAICVSGLELSREEFMNLRLSDLFDYVEDRAE